MLIIGETKLIQEKFYTAKKPTKIWDVNIDNIDIWKLVKTKTNSNYLIGYLDKAIRSLVLIMPKTSEYVKIFKVQDGDKDKNNKVKMIRSYKKVKKLFGLRLKILKILY